MLCCSVLHLTSLWCWLDCVTVCVCALLLKYTIMRINYYLVILISLESSFPSALLQLLSLFFIYFLFSSHVFYLRKPFYVHFFFTSHFYFSFLFFVFHFSFLFFIFIFHFHLFIYLFFHYFCRWIAVISSRTQSRGGSVRGTWRQPASRLVEIGQH